MSHLEDLVIDQVGPDKLSSPTSFNERHSLNQLAVGKEVLHRVLSGLVLRRKSLAEHS